MQRKCDFANSISLFVFLFRKTYRPPRRPSTMYRPSSGAYGDVAYDEADNSYDASSTYQSSNSANSLLSTDPVRWLIDQQSFNGAWSLTDVNIRKLTNGKSLSTFRSSLTHNDEALTTALAIAILESKYSSQNTLWNAVVNKGRKRLSSFGLTDGQINSLINEIKNKL